MEAVYVNAKALDAGYRILQDGTVPGKGPFKLTLTETIRYQAPNKFYVAVAASGSGAAVTSSSGQQLIVCDGKSVYVYLSQLKGYYKRPAPAAVPLGALLAQAGIGVPNRPIPGAKLGAPKTVDGHAAYQISFTRDASKLPANLPAPQKTLLMEPIVITVDKANYQVLSIKQGTQIGHASLIVDRQKVNGTLSASSFVFTPPAGAKELQTPTPPVGGMPGAPGGAPGGVPRRP
jgi:outer membrane lipoprotein-sorting protein